MATSSALFRALAPGVEHTFAGSQIERQIPNQGWIVGAEKLYHV